MSMDDNIIEAFEEVGEDIRKLRARQVSVLDFYDNAGTKRTDFDAFQAAINSLPDAADPSLTLISGEYPSYEILVPIKVPDLSATAGTTYNFSSQYLQPGKRSLTWKVDDGVRFGTTNAQWVCLNAPVITERGIHMPGFSNRKDTTNLALTSGPGALGDREAGITGFDPDTVATQAYQHERGRAALYIGVGDGSDWRIPGTGVTFTANTVTFPGTALAAAERDKLRPGMFLDTAGNMLTGSPVRHTSRLLSWAVSGSNVVLTVENWRKMTASPPYESSTTSTPSNGTPFVINPVNKLWGQNTNIFINKTDGGTYGHTSASYIEAAFGNETGADAGVDFDRDTHPFHLWGFDASHIGSHGGGIGFITRGKAGQRWTQGFASRGSATGFLSQSDVNGTADVDFEAKSQQGVGWDAFFQVKGNTSPPTINLGKREAASTPRINLFSAGTAGTNDSNWDAQISASGSNLRVNAKGSVVTDKTSGSNGIMFEMREGGATKGYFQAQSSGAAFNGGNLSVGITAMNEKLTVAGNVGITNGNYYKAQDSGGTYRNLLGITGSNDTVIGTNTTSGRIVLEGGGTGGEVVRVANNRNVGIGDTSPDAKLHVNSGTTDLAAIFESTDAGTLVAIGDNTGGAQIATNGGDFQVRTGGGAGDGNGAATKLIVKTTGQTRFVPLGSTPSGAQEGDVYYDFGSKKLKLYNGTAWVDL